MGGRYLGVMEDVVKLLVNPLIASLSVRGERDLCSWIFIFSGIIATPTFFLLCYLLKIKIFCGKPGGTRP